MFDRLSLKAWWGTPLVGLLGGFIASQIGWPLPWMVGSLLAIILVRCLTPWQLAEILAGASAVSGSSASVSACTSPRW